MGGEASVCGKRAYQTIDVRRKDNRMGGLSAVAAVAPPADGPLGTALDGGPDDVWAEVALLAVVRERVLCLPPRGYPLRMKFTNGCGYDLFKRAIRGFASELVSRRTATEDLQWFNAQRRR